MIKHQDKPSVHAIEGIKAHSIAESILKGEKHEDISSDMLFYVEKYIDYVKEHTKDSMESHIEKKVYYDNIIPDGYGTCDYITLTKDNTLKIIDLKYGRGVFVEAKWNTQLQLYAIGAINTLDINPSYIEIHIVQPRIDNFQYWRISRDELEEFKEVVRVAYEDSISINPTFRTGEIQCKYCPAKSVCRAYKNTIQNVDHIFSVDKLSMKDKMKIMSNKDLIISAIKDIEEEFKDVLESGGEIEGFKLVNGKSSRIWNEKAEKILIDQLGDKAYNKKLIGITEAKKIMNKNILNDITIMKTANKKLIKSNVKYENE